MNSCTPLRILIAVIGIVATAPLAQASVADLAPEGLLSGVVHPFRGMDHVLLLLCMGAWAAHLGRRSHWTVPAMFIAISACGVALGLSGTEPAMLQTMAMMALLTFTLLVLGPVRWTFALIAAPLGVLAFFQGMAHAPMLASGSDGMGFSIGLVAGSAMIYVFGLAAGVGVEEWIHHHHGHWTGHAGGRMAH